MFFLLYIRSLAIPAPSFAAEAMIHGKNEEMNTCFDKMLAQFFGMLVWALVLMAEFSYTIDCGQRPEYVIFVSSECCL
jgi:hypothetical protein